MSRRPPLSRERIASAALAYIDNHGMAALSMRKLGAELGVEAMSLYNHVSNKDDLLDAVAELLFAEILERYRTDPAVSWQHNARELAWAFRAVAYDHEHAFALISDRVLPSPAQVTFLRSVFETLKIAGYPAKEAALAFDAMSGWVVGAIRSDMGVLRTFTQERPGIDVRDMPPELQDFSEFADACVAWTSEQRFAYGLDTLIAGLEAQLARLGRP